MLLTEQRVNEGGTPQGISGAEAANSEGSRSREADDSPMKVAGHEDVSGSVVDREEWLDFLRLSMIEGVGPKTRRILLDRFGSAAAVFRAPRSVLRQLPGVGPMLAERIASAPVEAELAQLLELCDHQGVLIITELDRLYPEPLRQVSDPPGVLFCRGQLLPTDSLAVAIVGTRHPTTYGLRMARQLAAGLARAGVTVVSGLARGIDGAAHQAALEAGGRTIAVLASGVLKIYPPEHAELAEHICRRGALISESAPYAEPLGSKFPQRNRLISGLSLGTIVVEAGDHSGALITANHAMEQGREVFAVPGRAEDRTARGCNQLIRDGATLVETAEDVLEVIEPIWQRWAGRAGFAKNGSREGLHPSGFGTSKGKADNAHQETLVQPSLPLLEECERRVLEAIDPEATLIDRVVARTGLPVSEVLSAISMLELRQLIRRVGGNSVCRR